MTPTPDPSERTRALVEAAQRGDREALDTLLAEHRPDLYAFLRLRMGPKLRAKESISDLAQTICLEVLEKLDRFEYRGKGSFRHWLHRNALNELIDKQRFYGQDKRNVDREHPHDSLNESLLASYATFMTPSKHVAAAEEVDRIEHAFDRLPDQYREVVLLARLLRLPHREVAARMQRSEEATRTLLRRALVRLAALLDS